MKGAPWSSRAGERFGRLTLLSITRGAAQVRCDCGSEKTVMMHNLTAGRTQSCGCLAREVARASLTTHGMAGTRMYRLWVKMKRRCLNAGDSAFKDYGARGIRVCARWRSSVDAFADDIGPRPSPVHSVDRRDNDGHYSCGKCEECAANGWPANCRWATATDQARNTRRNIWLEHDGRRMIACDWAAALGISRQRMQQRIQAQLPPEKLFAPGDRKAIAILRGKVPSERRLHFAGRTQRVSEWAMELGILPGTIRNRLARGLPIERVLFSGRLPNTPAVRHVPENYRCGRCNGLGHNARTCHEEAAA